MAGGQWSLRGRCTTRYDLANYTNRITFQKQMHQVLDFGADDLRAQVDEIVSTNLKDHEIGCCLAQPTAQKL